MVSGCGPPCRLCRSFRRSSLTASCSEACVFLHICMPAAKSTLAATHTYVLQNSCSLLFATIVCVCVLQQPEMIYFAFTWLLRWIFSETVHSETHMCMPTAGCSPQWTSFATHMCVCAHSSNWFAKVIGCSGPSLSFFIGSCCCTHVCVHNSNGWPTLSWLLMQRMCVCAHSSNRSGKAVKMIHGSIDFFCTRHVCVQGHTCVFPQQQLVGQPSTFECYHQLPSSATHTCFAKIVECSEPFT